MSLREAVKVFANAHKASDLEKASKAELEKANAALAAYPSVAKSNAVRFAKAKYETASSAFKSASAAAKETTEAAIAKRVKSEKEEAESSKKELENKEAEYTEAVKVADAVYATFINNPTYEDFSKIMDAYKFLASNAVKTSLNVRICNYAYEYHTLLAKYSKPLSDKDKLASAKANAELANTKAEEAAIFADLQFICAFEPEKAEEIRVLADANVKSAHDAFTKAAGKAKDAHDAYTKAVTKAKTDHEAFNKTFTKIAARLTAIAN